MMPNAIYKQLGLDESKATSIRLLMVVRSMKHPVRILYDLLVQVITSIFPVDFVILECDIYVEIPIILGSPFLATGKELMDIESWKLKF